jgi:AraC-like DNA-binding protein
MFDAELKFVVSHNHEKAYSVNNHQHPFYELVFYKKGSGTTTIGGKQYDFASNTFSLIEPNVIHNEEASGPVDLMYIGFTLPAGEATFKNGVYDESKFHVLDDMEEIQREMELKEPYFERMLNLDVERIVISLERGATKMEEEKSDPFEYVESFIKLNCMKRLKVDLIAQTFGFSYDYFRRAFKQRYGIPIKEYITKEKMNCAIDFLKNTDFSIKQIADMTGFASASHFIVEFKKQTGETPHEFVEEHRRKDNFKEIAHY